MSERKRVELNTFEPQKVSDKVNKKECKTIRISVVLPEPNEDCCPEFNYKDELAAAKKRLKQSKEPNNIENGLDPFGQDDDDDVRRIALEMEAKYGTGMAGGKKKRKSRKDDYADIGMGYDESDSFIDNTDGYDEMVPQNVTTLHGGFYINCGALEFKTDEEVTSENPSSSSESEEETKPSVNRKRILESSDTESDAASTSQVEKDPKLQSTKNTMQQAIKKKLFSPNKIQVKKQRVIDPLKKTVKELLREKREDLNMSVPGDLKVNETEDTAEKDSLKENKKPMNISSVTDAIESVVKQIGDNYDKNCNKQDVEESRKSDLTSSKNDTPSALEADSSQEAYTVDRSDVKLPENLPADILNLINNIKLAALNYKEQGKKKFFTDEVNSMFLNLERMCKILGKSSRVKVYEYLSVFIKCRRETLMRRAKILVLEDDEKRLRRLIARLKDNIDQVMPTLLKNYEQESQRIIQKKFSKESIDNEENKALKMPRRRFQWTEESRKLLKDIVSVKKRCLMVEGKQKDNLEELVSQYLRTEILPLWPDGWMYQNALKKVYNKLVEHTSDSSTLNDNNNSSLTKNVTLRKHSNVTIKPVSVPKSSTSKAEDSPGSVTYSKIANRESKPAAKLVDVNVATSQSSNYKTSLANPIPVKATAHSPKHKVIQSVSDAWDLEKPRHENHNYSKQDVEMEVVKPIVDSGVIVVSKQSDEKKICEPSAVIPKSTHCQLIDLTERKSELKRKADISQPFMHLNETSPTDLSKPSRDLYAEAKKMSSKHPELTVSPTYLPTPMPKPSSKSEGDDIKMVMENLKALEMLSSPIKAENSAGSPVSVIAYNKSFSPKSNSNQSSAGPRTDFHSKNDFTASAQEEFQKQFLKSLHQRPTGVTNSKLDFASSVHEELQKKFHNPQQTRPTSATSSANSKTDYVCSPQEEFQKQFIKSLQPLAANLSTTTKPSYNSSS